MGSGLRGLQATVALCLAGAWGCGPGGDAAGEAPGRTVSLAVRADVTGFFPGPPYANEAYSNLINSNIFEGLVAYDASFALRPALADRWENPDDRTYRLRLREGARFSDGRAVTTADVAASLLAPGRRRWATRVYLQAIESARALDDRWVEIRTRAPDVVLLTRLPWGFVLPAGGASGAIKAVGTGPYVLGSWTPGRQFVLEANPHFRGPRPAFSRARFVVVPDEEERVDHVLRGAADVADQLTVETAERLQRSRHVRVVVGQGTRVIFLVLRADSPPFDDPRVRQAVSLALDRRSLVRIALGGYGQVASQLVPTMVAGYNPGIAVQKPDLDRARLQLAEAGYPQGADLRLDGTNNRYPRDVEILGEVTRQLGAAGIRVRINPLDKRQFFPLIDEAGSPFHLLGYACEGGDAGDALDQLAHSPVGESLGSFNSGGLEDPELDRLIDAANATASTLDRTRYLQEALRRLSELNVYVPLVIPDDVMLVSRRISWDPPLNFALRPSDMRPAPPGTPAGHQRERGRVSRLPSCVHTRIGEARFPGTQAKETAHMTALKGSRTHENLKHAFAAESQANRRYLYFARAADIEGYPEIGGLFRDTSEAETGHAFGHMDFLKSVGDPVTGSSFGSTRSNLQSAVEGETYEYTQMYPGMAKAAREEGFSEIAEWFETLAKAERSHAGRFTKGLEGLKEL